MNGSRVRRIAPAGAALAAALVVSGCFNPFSPRIAPERGTSSPPPVPNSASQVVELFAWCWNNRAYQEYTEIFTADFRFQYVDPDSAGSDNRGAFYDRTEELNIALNLFVEGSATSPPARSITLTIERPLIELPDPRPGKTWPWHKSISTDVLLRIDTGEQEFVVDGRARFFLVRGDSADIPTTLTRFSRDSTRWWIERWEDETDSGEHVAAGALSTARRPRSARAGGDPIPLSWARFKNAYRSPPGASAAR